MCKKKFQRFFYVISFFYFLLLKIKWSMGQSSTLFWSAVVHDHSCSASPSIHTMCL